MKHYILLMIIFSLTNICYGQHTESLEQRILKLETNQDAIQLNIANAHKKFSLGTMLLISGVATSTAAMLIYNKGIRNTNSDNIGKVMPSPVLLYIGGGLITAGTIIQIDSHKWIGRAGKKRK